jgi:chemotaxis methyl-accepting protein methylase
LGENGGGVMRKLDLAYKTMPYHLLKNIYRAFREQIFFNLLFYPYARIKHKRVSQLVPPCQEHTYTAFYRSPGQISALLGPVMNYLQQSSEAELTEHKTKKKLQINILAGSTGAEAYTMASVLLKTFKTLDFQIHCSDLHHHTVFKSQSAEYSAAEIEGIKVPEDFIKDTFDKVGDRFFIKPFIKERVTFFKADIVFDDLSEKYPPGDIVFIQNVLFHLDPAHVKTAFNKALSIAKKCAVIFCDGMSLDDRVKLTKEYSLEPLNYQVKQIHRHARHHVPLDWWNYYYGAEPYLFFKKDKLRRYATIFLRSGA